MTDDHLQNILKTATFNLTLEIAQMASQKKSKLIHQLSPATLMLTLCKLFQQRFLNRKSCKLAGGIKTAVSLTAEPISSTPMQIVCKIC